jgi:hypothetical protein
VKFVPISVGVISADHTDIVPFTEVYT